jgi:hypothetical protein
MAYFLVHLRAVLIYLCLSVRYIIAISGLKAHPSLTFGSSRNEEMLKRTRTIRRGYSLNLTSHMPWSMLTFFW